MGGCLSLRRRKLTRMLGFWVNWSVRINKPKFRRTILVQMDIWMEIFRRPSFRTTAQELVQRTSYTKLLTWHLCQLSGILSPLDQIQSWIITSSQSLKWLNRFWALKTWDPIPNLATLLQENYLKETFKRGQIRLSQIREFHLSSRHRVTMYCLSLDNTGTQSLSQVGLYLFH